MITTMGRWSTPRSTEEIEVLTTEASIYYNTRMDTKTAGSMGGKIILKKYGKDHFKKLSKKGLESRWAKIQKLPIDKPTEPLV